MNALSVGRLVGGLLAVLSLVSGCADEGGGQASSGASLGAGQGAPVGGGQGSQGAAASSAAEIPWECGATFSCVDYWSGNTGPKSDLPYGSHVEPGACALQLSWQDAPDHRLFDGGRGEMYGGAAEWKRTGNALVLCAGPSDDPFCFVCTPDPKTLPKTKGSPVAGCSGTPSSCGSRGSGECWHGCSASYGNAYTTSDDRCSGSEDPCEELGTADLCDSIPGCDWR